MGRIHDFFGKDLQGGREGDVITATRGGGRSKKALLADNPVILQDFAPYHPNLLWKIAADRSRP